MKVKGILKSLVALVISSVLILFFPVYSSSEIVFSFAGQMDLLNNPMKGKAVLENQAKNSLTAYFEIKSGRIYIHSMSLGSLQCQGYLGLADPYDVNISVDLQDVSLDSFLSFWIQNKEFEAKGAVKGEIGISGNLTRPFLKGSLEVSPGFIKDLQFNKIFLNAQGDYPNLEIEKLVIHQSDGLSLDLKGSFNLSDQKKFKKQIEALSMSPLVFHSDLESQWTIKQLGSTQIKYRLRKEKNSDSFSEENSPLLGIERKLEF